MDGRFSECEAMRVQVFIDRSSRQHRLWVITEDRYGAKLGAPARFKRAGGQRIASTGTPRLVPDSLSLLGTFRVTQQVSVRFSSS